MDLIRGITRGEFLGGADGCGVRARVEFENGHRDFWNLPSIFLDMMPTLFASAEASSIESGRRRGRSVSRAVRRNGRSRCVTHGW